MPLAKANNSTPVVDKPAAVTNVGSSETVSATREASRVSGQIRTHLVAHSMPSLLSAIDLTDEAKVKELITKMTAFVETGK
jgi:hypothetical protein